MLPSGHTKYTMQPPLLFSYIVHYLIRQSVLERKLSISLHWGDKILIYLLRPMKTPILVNFILFMYSLLTLYFWLCRAITPSLFIVQKAKLCKPETQNKDLSIGLKSIECSSKFKEFLWTLGKLEGLASIIEISSLYFW